MWGNSSFNAIVFGKFVIVVTRGPCRALDISPTAAAQAFPRRDYIVAIGVSPMLQLSASIGQG